MIDYQIRDRRRERIVRALTALSADLTALQTQQGAAQADRVLEAAKPVPDPAVLAALDQQLAEFRGSIETRQSAQAALRSEQDMLAASAWLVTDAAYRALGSDLVWDLPASLNQFVGVDPVLLALSETPKLTPELGQTLTAFRQSLQPAAVGPPPGDLLTSVANLPGFDQSIVEEILVAAHRTWLARRDGTSPFDHVGALLPVRIETLFPPEMPAEIWIRICPDEPSIARQRTLVKKSEAAYLQEFWVELQKRISNPPADPLQWLRDSKAAGEWSLLCSRVLPQRAAWLLASFPPQLLNGRPVVRIDALPDDSDEIRSETDVVQAWPEKVEVWWLDEDRQVQKLGVLEPIDPAEDTPLPGGRPGPLILPLPGRDSDLAHHWLTNFEEAQRMGLGRKFKLPAGVTAQSIRALLVIGLSDASSADLWQAHSQSGNLGILRLGEPTNTVQGAAAADLARTPADWLDVARRRLGLDDGPRAAKQRAVVHRLTQALTGEADSLSDCPLPVGPDHDPIDDLDDGRRFVDGLWPILWGHFLRDHLERLPGRNPPDVYDCWRWSNRNLHPEGPLPPVRIHDQPYGLLPVTSLAGWSSDDAGDDGLAKCEAEIAERLGALCKTLANTDTPPVTSQPPTVMGADTEGILAALNRDALTQTYAYRNWLRFEIFEQWFPNGIRMSPFAAWADAHTLPLDARPPGSHPPHITGGWPQYLELPLIAAERLPFVFKIGPVEDQFRLALMVKWIWQKRLPGGPPRGVLEWDAPERDDIAHGLLSGIMPGSLCLRLMIHSMMLAQAWAGQETVGAASAMLNPLSRPATASIVQTHRLRFDPHSVAEPCRRMFAALLDLAKELDQWLVKESDPLSVQDRTIQRLQIPPDRLQQLERAFRSTLDTASYRIDPWISGLPWRRLDAFSRSPRRHYAVGVYGWVDGPFRGNAGPTNAGMLHAPSHAQVITSVVLRDKFLSASTSGAVAGGQNTWNMNLASDRVRKAGEFADECRLGVHLFEVVGHQVEAILDSFPQVRAMRRFCPLHSDAADPLVVCHGIAAVKALLSSSPLPSQPDLPPGELAAEAVRLALTDGKRAAIQLLNDSLDAYADLMVADGVYHLVAGQPQRGADAMDAAAGFALPPSLNSIRTPPSGYRIQTTVVSVLPAVPPAQAGDGVSPCRFAEPALAAWIDKQFPDVPSYHWKISRKPIAADVVAEEGISLLRWTIAEAAALPEQLLADILVAVALAPQLGDQGPDSYLVTPPPEYFAARQQWNALSSQPLETRILRTSDHPAVGDAAIDEGVRAELQARLASVFLSLQALGLQASGPPPADMPSFLRTVFSWGIAPRLSPADQRAMYRAAFISNAPVSPEDQAKWLQAAAVSIKNRLDRMPINADGTPSFPADMPALARLLAELASDDGKLSILGVWVATQLKQATGISGTAPGGPAEADWLTQLAAVRAPLARIEAMQLQALIRPAGAELRMWSNNSGDPWHREYVSANAASKDKTRRESQPAPHLVAAFGDAAAWASSNVAAGLIDDFGESIPLAQRQSYAAFGFNAPAARPQQAILLAVPPVPRTQLTTESLVQMLIETRDLARARTVRPDDLREKQAIIPSVWLLGTGHDRVRLDTDSQYWNLD